VLTHNGGLVVYWLGRRTCDQQVTNLRVRFPAVYCWVSTWTGDHLRAGKSYRYVTGHL